MAQLCDILGDQMPVIPAGGCAGGLLPVQRHAKIQIQRTWNPHVEMLRSKYSKSASPYYYKYAYVMIQIQNLYFKNRLVGLTSNGKNTCYSMLGIGGSD
jgi:hypothetical protein